MLKRWDIGGDGVVYYVVVGYFLVGQVNWVVVVYVGFCQVESWIGIGLIGLNVRCYSFEVVGEVFVGFLFGFVFFVFEVYIYLDYFVYWFEVFLVV